MSERDALLRHILTHPDDDAPRLVFADWLDEHGEADRAAFIRTQIARENDPATDQFREIGEGVYPPAEAALLGPHSDEWSADLPAWARRDFAFRRGFIEDVRTTVARFLAAPKAIWRSCPILGLDLTSKGAAQRPEKLFARPELGSLRRLTIRQSRLFTEHHRAMCECLHTGRLRQLTLHQVYPLDVRAMPTVTAAPGLAGLWSLRLANMRFWLADARALASATFASGLVDLWLQQAEVGPDAATVLANTPALAGLRRLILDGNHQMGERGAIALAESPYLGELRTLGVSGCSVGTKGRQALRERFGDRVTLGEGQP